MFVYLFLGARLCAGINGCAASREESFSPKTRTGATEEQLKPPNALIVSSRLEPAINSRWNNFRRLLLIDWALMKGLL